MLVRKSGRVCLETKKVCHMRGSSRKDLLTFSTRTAMLSDLSRPLLSSAVAWSERVYKALNDTVVTPTPPDNASPTLHSFVL